MSSLVFIAKAQGDEAMKAASHMRALEKKMAEYFQAYSILTLLFYFFDLLRQSFDKIVELLVFRSFC